MNATKVRGRGWWEAQSAPDARTRKFGAPAARPIFRPPHALLLALSRRLHRAATVLQPGGGSRRAAPPRLCGSLFAAIEASTPERKTKKRPPTLPTQNARARADTRAPVAATKKGAKLAGDAGMVSNASLTVCVGRQKRRLHGARFFSTWATLTFLPFPPSLHTLTQEEEIERVVAPESAVKEEERLRAEREAAAAALPFAAPLEAVLTKTRADELDKLLNQTDLYTKFLSEQMESIEAKTDGAVDANGAAAPGDKRKAKGKEPAAKKSKPMATKVGCVCVERGGGRVGFWRVTVVPTFSPCFHPTCRSFCPSSRASCATTS